MYMYYFYCLELIDFLDLQIYSFYQIWKTFDHYSFSYFSVLALSFSYAIPISHMLDCLLLSQGHQVLISFFTLFLCMLQLG